MGPYCSDCSVTRVLHMAICFWPLSMTVYLEPLILIVSCMVIHGLTP